MSLMSKRIEITLSGLRYVRGLNINSIILFYVSLFPFFLSVAPSYTTNSVWPPHFFICVDHYNPQKLATMHLLSHVIYIYKQAHNLLYFRLKSRVMVKYYGLALNKGIMLFLFWKLKVAMFDYKKWGYKKTDILFIRLKKFYFKPPCRTPLRLC